MQNDYVAIKVQMKETLVKIQLCTTVSLRSHALPYFTDTLRSEFGQLLKLLCVNFCMVWWSWSQKPFSSIYRLFFASLCVAQCALDLARYKAKNKTQSKQTSVSTHTHIVCMCVCVCVCVCTEMCVYIGMSIIMTIMITDCFYVAGGG